MVKAGKANKAMVAKKVIKSTIGKGSGSGERPANPMIGGIKGKASGEVRFSTAAEAKRALSTMNGSMLAGSKVRLVADPRSQDNTKIVVHGIPERAAWQELKDHFASCGNVVFTDVCHPLKGEVRFETTDDAQQAVNLANGATFEGSDGTLTACLDPMSKDNTRILVANIPPGTGWQDVKDFFKDNGLPCVYAGMQKSKGGGKQFAEVRYGDAGTASQAMQQLDGSNLLGDTLTVRPAPNSQDSTKLLVTGFTGNAAWQDVKDHFGQAGEVIFCFIGNGEGGKGKGKGKGGGRGGGKGGGKVGGSFRGGLKQGGGGGGGGGGGEMMMMMNMMNMMNTMMQRMGGR